MIKSAKGITMVALVITIVIILILAGVAITQISGDGIIVKAEEAKLASDYQQVKTDLTMYKRSQQVQNLTSKEITDESLIGSVYKKVYINDTYRELAVIVDFNEINSNPTYGTGGKKLLEDDNNDKTTVKEIETVYQLRDIYAVDLTDDTLYYINENQIYSIDGKKVEILDNNVTSTKYAVETENTGYIQQKKFITKWNVTLGETEGSETYSTVVLPINKNGTYDAIIDWGDGTKTQIQHNLKGTKLTEEELKEKAIHTYTITDRDDTIRTIEIYGTYTRFEMGSTLGVPTKLKLVEIEQWGQLGYTNISLIGCSNLAGNIPVPGKKSFENLTTINFASCTNLTEIPKGLLDGCYNLQNASKLFSECTQITKIPEGFFKDCHNLTNVSSMFYNTSITEIPSDIFDTNNGQPNMLNDLNNAFGKTLITNIPEGIFDLCTEAKYFGQTGWATSGTFQGCTLLKSIPDNLFYCNTKVIDFSNLFRDCTSLEQKIPEDLFKNCPDAIYFFRTFRGCTKLYGNIPENLFENQNVNNFQQTFFYCYSLIGNIPEKLFETSTNATNFHGTFFNCKGLSGSIPAELFKNNILVTSFQQTFMNCTGLTGSVPKELFKYNTQVTTFSSVFENSKLEASEIEIGSSYVINFDRAFGDSNKDKLVSKIYLPVNGTTYDAYVAHYGADKVVTY